MVGEEVQGFDASQGHWMAAKITYVHGDNTCAIHALGRVVLTRSPNTTPGTHRFRLLETPSAGSM